jgi:predicted RNA-binding protein (virulence factor B family)
MSTTLFNGLKVNLRVSDKTPLGFTVLINDEHEGLLYHNEIFKPIIVGQNIVGYIKQIRPDGKIDVTLQQQGYLNITDNYQILIDLLGAKQWHNSNRRQIITRKKFRNY